MSTSRPARPSLPRPIRRAALAAAPIAALAACPPPALALFGVGDIVNDPSAKAKNVQKVAAMLAELQEMARQLEQLQRQVAGIDDALADPGGDAFDRAGQAMSALTQVQQTLARWQADLPADADPQSATVDGLPGRIAASRAYLRDRATQAEASLSAVEQDRRRTSDEVAAAVKSSNAAPGPTAAQQATNELQAIVSSEQAKLQALRSMRARLATDREAAAQAEEAAADAVRRREMDGLRRSAQAYQDPSEADPTGGNP